MSFFKWCKKTEVEKQTKQNRSGNASRRWIFWEVTITQMPSKMTKNYRFTHKLLMKIFYDHYRSNILFSLKRSSSSSSLSSSLMASAEDVAWWRLAATCAAFLAALAALFALFSAVLWDNPTSNLLAIVAEVTLLRQGWDVLYWIVIILDRFYNKLQPTTINQTAVVFRKQQVVQVCIL